MNRLEEVHEERFDLGAAGLLGRQVFFEAVKAFGLIHELSVPDSVLFKLGQKQLGIVALLRRCLD